MLFRSRVSVYNHMVLPVVYETLEDDYWHLREHVQMWDVACQVQVEIRGPDALKLVEWMTPRDVSLCEPGQCIYVTLLDEAGAAADEQGLVGWLFRLDQPTYVAVMTHARDRELRERFYRAWVTRASDQADFAPESDNSEVMERMLALRHEAAGLVGFANFAEYSLAPKMARSVEEVRGFLEELASRSRLAATEEVAELTELADGPLEAWDVAFWSERLRHRKYALSDEQLRPYFPLPREIGRAHV